MNSGRTLFSQMIDHLPQHEFRKCVARYRGNHRTRTFSCWDQLLCMAFAQFTFRESLRDIVTCLGSVGTGRYHMGIRGKLSRSTLADANESRDWRIFADFAHTLIPEARKLCLKHNLKIDLDARLYALDSTIIDLCVGLFPWAGFKADQRAVKLHTQLDLRGNIPTFMRISPANVHDVNFLDQLNIEPGAFYVMDRGYLDFERLYRFTTHAAYFVTRPRKNFSFRCLTSGVIPQGNAIHCDQTIRPRSFYPRTGYPQPLRRIGYYDEATNKRLTFITNNFTLAAQSVADIYRLRWQVELFFKWIKQHLRIKAFFGTSPNAVKTQVWVAVTVYLLVVITKHRLNLAATPHEIMQVLSVSIFEKTPIKQAFSGDLAENREPGNHKQLSLFEL
jgi:Transposase DDE domain/Domain of unknown function (DUF4372)